jgi:hypothetical protein
VVFSISALSSFLRPNQLNLSLSLSFSLAACVPAPLGVRVCICRGARSSRETEYKLKSRLFFSFFFVAQRRFFGGFYPNNLAEGKGQNRTEREREISLKIMDSSTQKNSKLNSHLNFHNNKHQEEKKYTKQTTFLLDALFFQRLENVLFHLVVSL